VSPNATAFDIMSISIIDAKIKGDDRAILRWGFLFEARSLGKQGGHEKIKFKRLTQ